jgi:hypothetical protein
MRLLGIKKTVILLLAGLLSLQTVCDAVVDLGSSAARTPYDRYMQPVRRVLGSLGGADPSMATVGDLMREGHAFTYSYEQPFVAAAPATTAFKGAGDCKDKTLWLAKEMNARNVRFVVGKRYLDSPTGHAWLLWRKDGQYWILDCTNACYPIPAVTVHYGNYVAQYSWSQNCAYRHAGASLNHNRDAWGYPANSPAIALQR